MPTEKKKKLQPFIGFALIGTIFAFVSLGAGLGFFSFPSNPIQALPLLGISGAMALIAILALIAAGFARVGLSQHKFALGLPEGSIRAVIALGLLVIFLSISVFFFVELDGTSTHLTGLTSEQVSVMIENDKLGGEVIATTCRETQGQENCRVTIKVERSAESKDVAKQMMTSIGTLVAAVSSFYFGSRAGESNSDNNPKDQQSDSPDRETQTDPNGTEGSDTDVVVIAVE